MLRVAFYHFSSQKTIHDWTWMLVNIETMIRTYTSKNSYI